MVAIARTVMAIAARALGEERREWALAMQAEFDAAMQDGKPLSFALGCLAAGWRELPGHPEGRYTLASYLVVLAGLLPAAAVLIASVIAGFPESVLAHAGTQTLLNPASGAMLVLHEGNRSAVPPLAILLLAMAVLHLRMAWLALDRRWDDVADAGAMSAAATVALAIFSAVTFADSAAALAQASVLTLEAAALLALARWRSALDLRRPRAF